MSALKEPIRFNIDPQQQEKEGYEISDYENNYYFDTDLVLRLKKDDTPVKYGISNNGFTVRLFNNSGAYKIEPLMNLIQRTAIRENEKNSDDIHIVPIDGNPFNITPENIFRTNQANRDAIMDSRKPILDPNELVDIYMVDSYKRIIRKKRNFPIYLAVSIIGIQEETLRYIMAYSDSIRQNYIISDAWVVVKAKSRLYDNVEDIPVSKQTYYVHFGSTGKARVYSGTDDLATVFRRKKVEIEAAIKDHIRYNKRDVPVLKDIGKNGDIKHALWLPEQYPGLVENDIDTDVDA